MNQAIRPVVFLLAAVCAMSLALPVAAEDTYDGYYDYRDLGDPYSGAYLHKQAGTTNMKVGEAFDAAGEMFFDHIGRGVEWVSSQPETASVSQTGIVTAKEPGRARVTVTYGDTWGQTRSITMMIKVTSGEAKKEEAFRFVITEGDILNLGELPYPGKNAGDGSVKWSTGDKTIASASPTGQLTANKPGSCGVIVRYTDPQGIVAEQSIAVRVMPRVHSRIGDPTNITLKVGETVDMRGLLHPNLVNERTYGKVRCSYSKAGILSTPEGGVIKAAKAGSVTVTVTHTDPGGEVVSETKIKVRVTA